MKRIKRLVALIGVVLFVSSAPTTAYAKADNFVLNTGALIELVSSAFASTPHGATVVLLGMLGITIGGAIGENLDTEEILNWGQKKMDELYRWIDNTGEELSITAEAMGMWLTDVGNGVLDTTSECWDAFKDWCCYLVDTRVDVPAHTDVVWHRVANLQEFIDRHSEAFDYSISKISYKKVYMNDISDKYINIDYNNTRYSMTVDGDKVVFARVPGDKCYVISVAIDGGKAYGIANSVGTSPTYMYTRYHDNEEKYADFPDFSMGLFSGFVYSDELVDFWQDYVDEFIDLTDYDFNGQEVQPSCGMAGLIAGIAMGYKDWGITDKEYVEEDKSDYDVADPTTQIIDRDGDLDKVRVGDATGELVDVVSIPIDGIGVGDVVTPYVVVPGVYPVDTVTGEIVGTDTPIEGIKPGVLPSVNNDYTIADLQELFPFCVPYDLVNLFSCLKAERKAPCFKFPLPVPKKGGGFKYKEIEIDLSDFDAAARVLRAMELLAFCVGLTLATRKLIRG